MYYYGESFFFINFSRYKKTNKPSVIVELAYIELVNESLEVVARQPSAVINGMA